MHTRKSGRMCTPTIFHGPQNYPFRLCVIVCSLSEPFTPDNPQPLEPLSRLSTNHLPNAIPTTHTSFPETFLIPIHLPPTPFFSINRINEHEEWPPSVLRFITPKWRTRFSAPLVGLRIRHQPIVKLSSPVPNDRSIASMHW